MQNSSTGDRGDSGQAHRDKTQRANRPARNMRKKPHLPGHRQQATDLEAALDECRIVAREGFRIAQDGLNAADVAIKQVSDKLHESKDQIAGKGRVRTSNIVAELRTQLHKITVELHDYQMKSRSSLKARRRELNEFSMALFGRTMVGKSTLMEILTGGNGASIGKGAQRTTRDVRTYYWRGLKVTDVPGVAAFEGAEDEKLAFEAAAKADLVLFLISDDAPQPVEAECLGLVRTLGKPLLGVCNVKESIEDNDDLRLFLRSQEKLFDKRRLVPLLKQFNKFADRHTPGHHINFFCTHLLSKFLATQPVYCKHRLELDRASRFQAVENQIILEVVGRGKFLRVKNFIDCVVTPMLDISNQFLDFSKQNSNDGRILVDKRREAHRWSQSFRSDGRGWFDTFVSKHMESLRDDITLFSEENYDRNDAGECWSKHIENYGLERKAQKLVSEVENECRKKLSEITRQIKAEIKFSSDFAEDQKFPMDKVFDSKRAWKWATTIFSGGLTIAAVILGSSPLGWAAAAVAGVGWLFSLFFEDHEKKVRKRRNELAKRLNKDVGRIERDLRKKLHDWFDKELLQKQVEPLLSDLQAVTDVLFTLADTQRELAWILNRESKKLHRKLLLEALRQLDQPDLIDLACDVARVPGFATMLVIEPKTKFPMDTRKDIENLLGERIWFVLDTGNRVSILKQAIGRDCDPRRIRIEKDIQIAHLPVGELDAVGHYRIRLAQQLTELHVMK